MARVKSARAANRIGYPSRLVALSLSRLALTVERAIAAAMASRHEYRSGHDPRTLRDALGCFATGVTVVTCVSEGGEPAGLTGLWQVTKRGRGKRLSDEERIQLDVLYAKTFSFRLDVLIFIRTLKALWQKEDM